MHRVTRFRVVRCPESPSTGCVLHLDDEFDDPMPAKRVRRLVSIYDGTDLEDALATMRRLGTHVARAFDEDGATTGVIFLEDIIEELVGEVQDATRRG